MSKKKKFASADEARDYYQKYPATLPENVLLEYATGVGKSKAAMECAAYIGGDALIIHHRVLHKNNWEEEIKKWGYTFNRDYITYKSLKKVKKQYDVIIVDECHHVTPKSLEFLLGMKPKKWVMLSATVSFDKKKLLRELTTFKTITVNIKDAIDYGILPEPNIYLVECNLDHTTKKYVYEIKINRNSNDFIPCDYHNYKKFLNKNNNLRVRCTQHEYLIMLNDNIDYLKKQYFANKQEFMKFRWLAAASDRKKFLAYTKTQKVKEFLSHFKDDRTITFAYDIDQSIEIAGNSNYCIDSKNGNYDLVEKFNDGDANKLFAVGVLNEGMNIYNIDYAFIISLNGNEKDNIQRLGRSFRSEVPEVFIFLVPYSRDQDYYDNLKEEIGDYIKPIKTYDDFRELQKQSKRE